MADGNGIPSASEHFVYINVPLVSAGPRCDALRLFKVDVPSEVVVGTSATLRCRYDLEGDTLYSVKWYKNGKEFFRFVLKDSPPSQIFPLEGIRVNVNLSNLHLCRRLFTKLSHPLTTFRLFYESRRPSLLFSL